MGRSLEEESARSDRALEEGISRLAGDNEVKETSDSTTEPQSNSEVGNRLVE
jgi:hypothetical protein